MPRMYDLLAITFEDVPGNKIWCTKSIVRKKHLNEPLFFFFTPTSGK